MYQFFNIRVSCLEIYCALYISTGILYVPNTQWSRLKVYLLVTAFRKGNNMVCYIWAIVMELNGYWNCIQGLIILKPMKIEIWFNITTVIDAIHKHLLIFFKLCYFFHLLVLCLEHYCAFINIRICRIKYHIYFWGTF